MNTNLNCFSLINGACKKIKGNFWKLFLANLIVIFPLVAISFIPYYIGLIIATFFSGYLFYGLIEYYKQIFRGENPSYKVIFNNYKRFGAATLIGIINAISLIIGFVVLIFPALAFMVYYGLSMYILSDQKEVKVKDAYSENAERMVENKTLILSYKVLFYFLYALVFGAAALLFIPITWLYATNVALAIFIAFMVVIVAVILITLISMLYNATQLHFYLTSLTDISKVGQIKKERNEKIIEKKKQKLEKKQANKIQQNENNVDTKE